MDDPPGARGTKLNQLPLGMKQSEYGRILKETVECFFGEVEMRDYELNKRCKKKLQNTSINYLKIQSLKG